MSSLAIEYKIRALAFLLIDSYGNEHTMLTDTLLKGVQRFRIKKVPWVIIAWYDLVRM
jgi:hypothetical protein